MRKESITQNPYAWHNSHLVTMLANIVSQQEKADAATLLDGSAQIVNELFNQANLSNANTLR